MHHLGPSQPFTEQAKEFASIGFFISEVSRYELELDQLLIWLGKTEPEIAKMISTEYPKQAMKKVIFVVELLLICRRLRMIPMTEDGYWSLSYFFYASEQVFDVRNHLAHGAIDITINELGRRSWVASKANVRREKAERATYAGIVRYKFSEWLLECLWHDTRVLRKYVSNVTRFMKTGEGWEQYYQQEKVLIGNRQALKEMGVKLPSFLSSGDLTLSLTLGEAQQ